MHCMQRSLEDEDGEGCFFLVGTTQAWRPRWAWQWRYAGCVPEDESWQWMRGIAAAVALNLRRRHRLLNPRRRFLASRTHPATPLLESSMNSARKMQTAESVSSCRLFTILPPTQTICTAQPFYRPIQSNSTLLYTWPINDP